MSLSLLYIILGVILIISIVLSILFSNRLLKFIMVSVASICFIIGAIVSFSPLLDHINYGLDLQGGFEVLYEISPIDEDDTLDSDMVYNTYQALLRRIDILGVSEPEITIEGNDRIRVKLAGVTNKEEAREILSSTASLTFRDTSNHLLMTSEVLGGKAKVSQDKYGKPAVSLSIRDKDTFYDVTSKVSKMSNNVIVIWLDYEEGKDSYSKEQGRCGSLSDSHCLSAASVDQGFSSDVIISGNFSNEEASSLVELINSGALPTKLEEISSRTVEASFGADSLNKTLYAGVIGIALVIAIMILVYRFSGFIASIGVLLYTSFTFLIFYLIHGVLTLPGIAAILLGIGMAVDANVISFERIKERLKIGFSLEEAFKIGNNASLASIMDANITTMIVAVILFIFGESSVKGFATMLIISIIVTVLVMVFLVKFILGLFVKTHFFDYHPWAFIGVSKKKIHKAEEIEIPYQKLDFVGKSKFFMIFTVLIIILGVVFAIVRGANLGVDFTGGTTITLTNNDKVTLSVLEKEISDMKYTIRKSSESDKDITITIEEVLNKDHIKDLSNQLEKEYETDSDIYTVSKVVKQELTKNAIKSLIIASIGILLYIAFRFRFNYAISAILALVHDVTIIILFFCIFHLEITSIFIAAILTIIGYSINDTIVTFDMIRENYHKMLDKKNQSKKNKKKEITDIVLNKDELTKLVNDSVRITFFRSILTTITTIFPVICLMIWGAREIFNFNLALLVGFIAGVYSSICIASQIWLLLEIRRVNKPKKEDKDIDDINEIQVKGVNC